MQFALGILVYLKMVELQALYGEGMKQCIEENVKSSNLVWHPPTITREQREALAKHRSVMVWFTGLSGAGKSTLAHAVEQKLHRMGCHTFVFDGDNVRHGLCSDLGFSAADRVENVRRIGEMATLFLEAGVIALTAFISPFSADRARVRALVPDGDFLEIYCRCSLQVCEGRDTKGLYKRARAGEVEHFTGISSPYEEPTHPELVVDTGSLSLEASVEAVIELLRHRGILKVSGGSCQSVVQDELVR
jgi:adenylylsulfate kinase